MNILYHKKQLHSSLSVWISVVFIYLGEDNEIPLIENYDIKIEVNKFALDVQQFINENQNSKVSTSLV